MKIMDCIFYLDLFGQKPELFINKKTIMRTYLGLLISLLTYILFILIFLYELQDVVYKQNPNIMINNFDAETYKSSITFNNNTFRFIVAESNDERTKYFKLEGNMAFSYHKSDELIHISKPFNFSKCESHELGEDYNGWFNKNNNSTALCPRNLYSSEFENITNFEFYLIITLRECMGNESGCIVNKTIYDEIKEEEKTYLYTSLFKSMSLNVFENDKPFYSKSQISDLSLGKECRSTQYLFGINELISNQNLIFKSSKLESNFDLKKTKVKYYDLKRLRSKIFFRYKPRDNIVKVTVRSYKSLSTVIANSFSLIRLALFIINKLVKYHVKYSIEEVILAKNFYFGGKASDDADNSYKVMQRLDTKKPLVKLFKANGVKKPPNQGNLSIKDIYTNISCWRYFLCRRRNNALRFYKEAGGVMSKYLSIEYLLYTLLEFKRLKLKLKEDNNTKVTDRMTENVKIAFIHGKDIKTINNSSMDEDKKFSLLNT
jgi:hypothetical protein